MVTLDTFSYTIKFEILSTYLTNKTIWLNPQDNTCQTLCVNKLYYLEGY